MNKEVLAFGINRYDFPEDLAKKIVKKLNKNKDWEPSLVGGGNMGDLKISIRSSFGANLYGIDKDLATLAKSHITQCVKDYSKEFSIDTRKDEGLNVLKYEDYDKYEYHTDAGWNTYRVFSGLIYLNPQEYAGGETHFKYLDLGIKPSTPSVVLFPSNYMYLHSAMPLISGKKYVIVTWFNDSPQ